MKLHTTCEGEWKDLNGRSGVDQYPDFDLSIGGFEAKIRGNSSTLMGWAYDFGGKEIAHLRFPYAVSTADEMKNALEEAIRRWSDKGDA